MSRKAFLLIAAWIAAVGFSDAVQAGLVAKWTGDDLNGSLADGAAVTAWTDSVGSLAASQATASQQPTLAKNSSYWAGHSAVNFNESAAQILKYADPLAGATSFTMVAAFRSNDTTSDGTGEWYQGSGIVDLEQPGWTTDYGLVLYNNGVVGGGIGCSTGDVTAKSTSGYNDNKVHVAVYRWDSTAGTISLQVDNGAATTISGVTNAARGAFTAAIGGIQTGAGYLNGQVGEVQLYNNAVTDTQAASTVSFMQEKYNLGLLGRWVGDDLTGSAGTSVSTWTDQVKSAAANAGIGAATVTESGFNGHKGVHFDGGSNLRVASTVNPMSGAGDFTISVVFNSNGGGTSTAGLDSWWSQAGMVDGEQPGGDNDWGLSLSAEGVVGAGIGNPDVTLHSLVSSLNDGKAHVAVYRREGSTLYLTVDGQTATYAGATSVARKIADMVFGSLQTNSYYYFGDIAQVDIYGRALTSAETLSISQSLGSTYGASIIPEPGTIILLFSGIVGLFAYAWRKRK